MVRVVAAHRDPAEVTVEDIMSSPVVCCRPEAGLDEVREVMAQNRIRHVPVVDRREQLTGIVASDDVLTRRISEREDTIDALCAYIHGPGIHVG
jgi:CBS domain-containing protein